MGEKTQIAWCDHTFNGWIGCMKVSAGCDNCYAETLMDARYRRVAWGQRKTETTEASAGTRVRTSADNWKQPLRWARKAREALEDYETGMLTLRPTRPKVFCSSLADVFDNQIDPEWRTDLFRLIASTRDLDWLLLTKRPENIAKLAFSTFTESWPNVWLGTTAEDQDAFDKRWPILEAIPARVRFISYEPAIGPLTMVDHKVKPDWLICGGESGRGFRPMPLIWAENIMEECEADAVPFFMKQLAGLKPIPDDLMVRQFPPGAAEISSQHHGGDK